MRSTLGIVGEMDTEYIMGQRPRVQSAVNRIARTFYRSLLLITWWWILLTSAMTTEG